MSSGSFRMRGFRRAAVAAAFLVFSVLGTKASAGTQEPNDSIATATPLGLSGFGTAGVHTESVGDGPAGESDVDLFALTIPPELALPARLTVFVRAPAFGGVDGFLRLFDASGVELANDDDFAIGTSNPQIQTYLLDAGTYYVGVSGAGNPFYDASTLGSGRGGSTGTYSLLVTLQQSELPPMVGEPSSFPSPQYSVPGGGSFEIRQAFIGDDANKRRDVDSYRFGVTAPARVDIEVRAASNGSTLDPVVELFAFSSMGLRSLNSRDDNADGSHDPKFSVRVPELTTNLLLVVSGSGNRDYSYPAQPKNSASGIGSVGPYDLIVNVTPLESSGTNEPNDSIMIATWTGDLRRPNQYNNPISSATFTGLIGDGPFAATRGDRDFYEVMAATGGVLTVNVKPAEGSELQPYVVAYDRAGNKLATATAARRGAGAETVLPIRCAGDSPFRLDSAALIYILVMGTGQRPPDDPAVPMTDQFLNGEPGVETFAFGDGPGTTGLYEVSFRVRPGLCGDEPNDVLAHAVDSGLVNAGTFACTEGILGDGPCAMDGKDVDMWRFQVHEAPAILQVTGDSTHCGFGDEELLRLHVYDADGIERAAAADSEDGGTGLTQLEVVLSEPGEYFVTVTMEGNRNFDPLHSCSGIGKQVGTSAFDLLVTLTPTLHAPLRDESPLAGPTRRPIFATVLDDGPARILALDPATGGMVSERRAPESIVTGAEGLAYDGQRLYYLGLGKFPRLYQLDPGSGAIQTHTVLTVGSGYFGDMALLGSRLYVLDIIDYAIHAVDPATGDPIRTLNVELMNDVSIGGGLAALSSHGRLYVGDAFQTGNVMEIDAATGDVLQTIPSGTVRPTAMASTGDGRHLAVADWLDETAELIDAEGTGAGSIELPGPPGSLAGQAFVGPIQDCNGNSTPDDVDLTEETSRDCNNNGLPDECDLDDPIRADCNANRLLDECEPDCDGDRVPNECEILSCKEDPACADCNRNFIPDGCELDCNGNRRPDDCDVEVGIMADANRNGRPDDCETVIYVSKSAEPGGDGTSWAKAFQELRDALAGPTSRSSTYVEVRIAVGTYAPAPPGGDRSATFLLRPGMALLGGFVNSADQPDRRDFTNGFSTILSGDLDGDDIPSTSENSDENSYHVLILRGAGSPITLDGVVITAGHANGPGWEDRFGAGVFNDGAALEMTRCLVSHHDTGQHIDPWRPTGGIRGANAVFNRAATARIVDSNFEDHLDRDRRVMAGVILNQDSRVEFIGCAFRSNRFPGSVIANDFSDALVENCQFHQNSAVFGSFHSRTRLRNCVFGGNGTAIQVTGGSATVENSLVYDTSGPSILCRSSLPAVPSLSPAKVDVLNSILWDGSIVNENGSTITIRYTDIAGGWTGPGEGNLDVDPQFVDPVGPDGEYGTPDDNVRLLPTSPLIDAGDPATVVEAGATDLDGHARILCARIDMGPYESGIGDGDCNRSVDLTDFVSWASCRSGPVESHPEDCTAFDFDLDGDVDLSDFAGFQHLFDVP